MRVQTRLLFFGSLLCMHTHMGHLRQQQVCCPVGALRMHASCFVSWTSADISELNLSKGMSIKFPEGKDKLLVFEITMKPDEGMYK